MGNLAKVCLVSFLLFCVSHFSVFSAEEEVRDVFQSTIQAPEMPTAIVEQVVNARLEGISIGSKGAFAIINGQLYREGEEKQGIKVTKIRKREVDIIVNGIASTLRMVVGQGTEPSALGQPAETQGPVGLDQISQAPVGLSGASEEQKL